MLSPQLFFRNYFSTTQLHTFALHISESGRVLIHFRKAGGKVSVVQVLDSDLAMSQPDFSGEKLRLTAGSEESSSLELDEDSGHDSVDDISTPADERERIASLETAVAWIRDEVVSLARF